MCLVFVDESLSDDDDWWKISAGLDGFNSSRGRHVWSSIIKVFDKSMSAFVPCETPVGDLPHLLKIDHKPKPIGGEFKCIADSQTGIMLHLEIMRGKKEMGRARHVDTHNKASLALRQVDGENIEKQQFGCVSNPTTRPSSAHADTSWRQLVFFSGNSRVNGSP